MDGHREIAARVLELLSDLDLEQPNVDDYGRLWRTAREVDCEPFVSVEDVNSTAKPDGSYKRYFLRVPPSVRSARRALAWTFGLTRKVYLPAVES